MEKIWYNIFHIIKYLFTFNKYKNFLTFKILKVIIIKKRYYSATEAQATQRWNLRGGIK